MFGTYRNRDAGRQVIVQPPGVVRPECKGNAFAIHAICKGVAFALPDCRQGAEWLRSSARAGALVVATLKHLFYSPYE